MTTKFGKTMESYNTKMLLTAIKASLWAIFGSDAKAATCRMTTTAPFAMWDRDNGILVEVKTVKNPLLSSILGDLFC